MANIHPDKPDSHEDGEHPDKPESHEDGEHPNERAARSTFAAVHFDDAEPVDVQCDKLAKVVHFDNVVDSGGRSV